MAENIALDRIGKLLDEGSFVELGAYVSARVTDFSLKEQSEPSDGVITGYGQIDGTPVFVYSQNRAVLNGTIGEMHAKKIADLYDRAMRSGAPVIGLIDCGGFRLQESVDALEGFSSILAKQMACAGELLMVSGVFGICAGGMTMVPALSDFTYMVKGADMFVNAPHTVTDDKKISLEYDAAAYQSEVSGQAEVVETEDEVIAKIRALVAMVENEDYGCCDQEELNRYVTATPDTRALLCSCADHYDFMEIRPAYYPEMVTGFMKLNGILVGAVGNVHVLYDENGSVKKELPKGLTAGGCEKAAEFIEFCSAAQIPLLTVSSADGFSAVADTEAHLPKALAHMMSAMGNLDGAKVSLIAGDTYGTAFVAMNTKPLWCGSSLTFAWNSVKVGMMEAEKAANILFAKDEAKEKQAAAYESRQNSVLSAAAHGVVDDVIDPKDTRKHLIMAFSML